MKQKIYCSVCQLSFVYNEETAKGKKIICSICGAVLYIEEISPEIIARRPETDHENEIRERVDNFAALRGYTFRDGKENIIEGLLGKYEKFGDFYCPCRFDNIPENICPCLETRMSQVKKEGKCL